MGGAREQGLGGGLSALNAALPAHNNDKQTPHASTTARTHVSQLDIPACFSEVLSKRSSHEPAHLQQVAALEAVRMTLPQSNTVNATTYLAAIILSVERLLHRITSDATDKKLPIDDFPLLANLLYLTSLAIPAASMKVIQLKSAHFLSIALSAATSASSDATHLVRRHAATVVASILAVIDAPSWSAPSASTSFNLLLGLLCDTNPKVRRRARDAVDMLFSSAHAETAACNTMSALIVACTQRLLPRKGATADPAAITAALQLLPAIEVNIKGMRQKERAVLLDQLVKLVAANSPHLTSMAYRIIAGLLLSTNISQHPDYVKDINAVAMALLKLPIPASKTGVDGQTEYTHALCAIAQSCGPELPASKCAKLLQNCLSVFRRMLSANSDNDDVAELKSVLARLTCIVTVSPWVSDPAVLQMLVSHLMDAEIYSQTKAAFKPLRPLAAFLEESDTGAPGLELPLKNLVKLVRPNLTDRPPKAMRQPSREILMGMMKGGFLMHILSVRPISFDAKARVLINADLVPLIRDNVESTRLAVFFDALAPCMDNLLQTAKAMDDEQAPVEAKNLRILYSQIIQTLPAFCTRTREWHSSAAKLETVLSATMPTSDSVLMRACVGALRKISETSTSSNDDRGFLSALLKKVLPRILDALESAPTALQDELCDCIKVCLSSAANLELSSTFMSRAIEKISGQALEPDSRIAETGMEAGLAIALSGSLSDDNQQMNLFIETLFPVITGAGYSSTLQKRSYKTLSRLLEAKVVATTEELSSKLINPDAIKNASPGCRSLRMKCLKQIVESIDSLSFLELFCSKCVVEVVLGCRDTSSKSRESAFALLLSTARRYRALCGTSAASVGDETGLRKYLKLLAAGLAAKTSSMIAATLAVLSRLLYEYRGEYRLCSTLADEVDQLVVLNKGADGDQSMGSEPGIIPILLRHESLEAVRASAEFFKVMCVAMPADRLEHTIPVVLPSLLSLSCQSKNELRIRVRFILERMIRKCGYETVASHFPEDHMKLVTSIRKELERNKRKKEKCASVSNKQHTGEGEDMDVENDDEDDALDIEELLGNLDELDNNESGGEDDDNLDLLEALPQKTNRKTKKRERKEEGQESIDAMEGFGLSADGRPIFNDLDAPKKAVTIDDDGEESDEGDAPPKGKKGGNVDGKANRKPSHSGEMYRNKKGKGDVRKEGKHEPFAFVPFGPKMFGSKRGKGSKPGSLQSVMQQGGGSQKRRKRT